MSKIDRSVKISEAIWVAFPLAFVGGFLDAHTYIFRGGVFATAQTGNLVLSGIHLSLGEFSRARGNLVPILAFVLGIFLTEVLKKKDYRASLISWQHRVLLWEALILLVIGFLPSGVSDAWVTVVISFVSSMQVNSFQRMNHSLFATTMCTGNLRSATEYLYRFWSEYDFFALQKFFEYAGVIFVFCMGAACGAILTELWGGYALFTCVVILTALVSAMLLAQRHLEDAK